jgi:hypothetical protein
MPDTKRNDTGESVGGRRADDSRETNDARGPEDARAADDMREMINDADETDDTRWGAIYASALVFTALVILAMWLFSRAFSS